MPTVSIVFNLPEAESTKWNAKRQQYDTALNTALNGKEIKVAVTDGDVAKVKAGTIRDALLPKISSSEIRELLNKGNLSQEGTFNKIQEYDLAIVVKDRAGKTTRVKCKADLESTKKKIKIQAMKKPAFEDLLK